MCLRTSSDTLPLPLRERAGVRGKRMESKAARSAESSNADLRDRPSSLHSVPLTQPSPAEGEGANAKTNATPRYVVLPGVTPCNRFRDRAKRTHRGASGAFGCMVLAAKPPRISPVVRLTQVD